MKALLGKVLGSLLFREAEIRTVMDVTPRVRVVRFEQPSLRGVPCTRGDKLQVFLPDAGMRTYTPVGWDSERGTFELVIYLRPEAGGPGTRWARGLVPGQSVQFFGPRRSIHAADAEDVVVFGDETSLGVVRALREGCPRLRAVLEVHDAAAVTPLLGDAANWVTLVPHDGDRRFDFLVGALQAHLPVGRPYRLLLTGAAPSIQQVQKGLKKSGIRASASKAYWAPGKSGLD